MRRLWDRLVSFTSSKPASAAVQAGRRRKTRETVKRLKPRTPRLELLDRREMFATFTVLSDADAGPNTLRAAIESANATPGSDSIAFNIPGANVKSILLKTPLPTITESVTIDGYTQPGAAKNIQSQGWNGNIRVTVAPGLQFSGDSYGLRIQGDNTTVKGLNIWGFQTTTDFADNEDVLIIDTGVGVFIDGADGCVLEGNRIWGNQEQGVFILHGSNNRIGGATPAARNLIYDNGEHGIVLFGDNLDTTGNKIQGNFIGTADGLTADGNGFAGVRLMKGVTGNTIGGTAPGEGNVIGGNRWGVELVGQPELPASIGNPGGNFIQGNLIGANASGVVALPNSEAGVLVRSVQGATIGGTTPGARNIISGNAKDGVRVEGGWVELDVVGNWIGLTKIGGEPLPNQRSGLYAAAGANATFRDLESTPNIVSGNKVGVLVDSPDSHVKLIGQWIGTSPGGGSGIGNLDAGVKVTAGSISVGSSFLPGPANVVSGNSGPGVWTTGGSTAIYGAKIGTNPAGTAAVGNFKAGVFVEGGTVSIKGTTQDMPYSDEKVTGPSTIAGNLGPGVWLAATAPATTVAGNRIGVSYTDDGVWHAIGNQGAGVYVDNSASHSVRLNTIGANQWEGVLIKGAGATKNELRDNKIGFKDMGNGGDGVRIQDAPANHIGDVPAVPKYAYEQSNKISANKGYGVFVAGAGSTGNVIEGNTIGGLGAGEGNKKSGVLIYDSASNTQVHWNHIHANAGAGIQVSGLATTGNVLTLNQIGAESQSSNGAGNGGHGILISGSPGNQIGQAGLGNTVGGNGGYGIVVQDVSAIGNSVLGNAIGAQFNGVERGNIAGGLLIFNASKTTVGSSAQSAGNQVIRNHGDGIVIRGPMATDNVVQGNEIGASFNLSAGNFSNGIVIDGAPSNTIGGIQAGEANYIGANRDGIVIRGAAAKYNTVLGNHVGRYPSGASTAPNTGWGIYVDGGSFNKIGSTDAGGANDVLLSGAGGVLVRGATAKGNQVSGNLIGTTKGDAVNAGNNGPGVRLDTGANQNQVHSNIIGYNHGNGIEVVGNNSIGNSLRFNSLRVNDKLGIDLGANGVTLNDATDLDNGPNQYQNFPVLKTAQFANEILTVTGTLTSIPNLKYAIDFYGDPGIDPTGHGEGRFYLGTIEVTTDGAGFAAISANLGALATGKYISATATPLSRGTPSTSELAKSIQIAGVNAALAAPQLVSPLSRDATATASSNLSNGLRAEGEGTAASDSKLASVVAVASSRNSAPNAASQLETLLAAAHRNDPQGADAALRDLFADRL